ncbi:hypothetical protein KDN24_06880 [Bacillus sp. Bva_UNVM-123]|uniref:hypothetical protein n=1 Tax=Bacillus sp. Bva_UNVM-123 TaxID=2829798 RepID=UPI00391F3913
MAAENIIEFKNIKGFMMYTIVFDNDMTEEVSLEVGCAEDIEMQMEMFFNRKWNDLFEGWYDPYNFMYATFNGIRLVNEDSNQVGIQIYGNYKIGSAKLDLNKLLDSNADKLKRIREIINE